MNVHKKAKISYFFKRKKYTRVAFFLMIREKLVLLVLISWRINLELDRFYNIKFTTWFVCHASCDWTFSIINRLQRKKSRPFNITCDSCWVEVGLTNPTEQFRRCPYERKIKREDLRAVVKHTTAASAYVEMWTLVMGTYNADHTGISFSILSSPL
jgi:hypothetical protein